MVQEEVERLGQRARERAFNLRLAQTQDSLRFRGGAKLMA